MGKLKYSLFRSLVHFLYLALMYSIFMHVPEQYVLGKIICIFALVFGYLYSINHSKQALDKTEQFQAILDAIPGFVSWIDKDLNYLGVNSKMSTFFGIKETNFIGKKLGQMTEYQNDFLVTKAKDLFASKKSMIQCEIQFFVDDKSYWNLLTLQKYNDDQKAVLISIDITELKLSEDLIKMEEAKIMHNERLVALGEMATTIAHEINNPLTLISASNSIIEKHIVRKTLDLDVLTKVVGKNRLALTRVRDIIKGIQNLARDGRNEKMKPSSLFGILDDVLIFESKKCQDNGVELEVTKPVDDIVFNGVPVQVGQVLIVLLNNAIDAIASLSNKWIKVTIENSANEFKIFVTDSGLGIPEAESKNIFDSFYTTKDIGKGTGIGLNIAKKIMDSHGGTIEINHKHPNTQFVLTFSKVLVTV
jgi:signal transduction histidine kinase